MNTIRGMIVAVSLALLVGMPSTVWAQSGGIQGHVVIKNDDDSTEPANNVLIELYRLGIKGQYRIKTDKNGRFAHIGLPYGEYAVILSGDGLNPFYEYGIRIPPGAPTEKNYEMMRGTGQRLTLEDVERHRSQSGEQPTVTVQEQQKQMEEAMKKQAEQAKAAARDEQMIKHFEAGKQLASSNLYEQAIGEYKTAMQLSPDHPQVYVVMGVMAQAYFNHGVQQNNSGQREAAPGLFALSAETAKKAAEMVPADKPAEKPQYLKLYAQAMQISARFDNRKVEDAVAAYQQLIDVQTTPAEKLDSRNQIAQIYIDAGQTDTAVAIYKEILGADSKNLDAMFGLGQALAASPNPGDYPEAVKVLEEFVKQASRDKDRADKVEQAKAMANALKEFLKQK